MELLLHTTSLLGASGQWNSYNTLPHRLGQWVVELPHYTAAARVLSAVEGPQCTAVLHGGSGQWICYNTPRTALVRWVVELLQWNSCIILLYCSGAVGSATCAMHRRIFWGHWAVELLQHTASLPRGSRRWNPCGNTAAFFCGGGQWSSCNAPPHSLGAMGSGTLAMHCRIALGQWEVELLHHTATLLGGSGQWNSCCTLLHCPGAMGSSSPHAQCSSALGQWAVGLLQYTAALPWGNEQWNSCHTLLHCLVSMGSGTPTIHRRTAWWAVRRIGLGRGGGGGGNGFPGS